MTRSTFARLAATATAAALLGLAAGPVAAAHGHGGGGHGGGHGGGFHAGHGGGFHAGHGGGFSRGNFGGFSRGHIGGFGGVGRGFYGYSRGYNPGIGRGFYGYSRGYYGSGLGLGLLGLGYGLGYGRGYYGGNGYPAYSYYNYSYPNYGYPATAGYGTSVVVPGAAYPYAVPAGSQVRGYYNPSVVSGAIGTPAIGALTDNRAHLRIVVPANAQVWIEDTPMTQTGASRVFVSPELQPDKTFTYAIRARWDDNGRTVEQDRTVPVRANQWSFVDFTRPETDEATPAVP